MRTVLVLPLMLAALLGAQPGRSGTVSTDPRLLRPNLVEVAPGRHLHFACVGQGSPTLVFEQGGEGSIANWRRIQAGASAITRACFYDRAGFGFSDPPEAPITAVSVTDDLRTLLRNAEIDGPIVLVGHSIGGFYATMYADRFPEQVTGLVLIEPGFAGQFNPSSSEQRRREQENMLRGGARLRACAALARQGKLSRDNPEGCFGLPSDLTADEAAYVTHMFTQPVWYESVVSQSESYFPSGDLDDSPSWRQEREARRHFGDMPLVVLTAAVAPREDVQDDAAFAEASERWRNGHKELATRSARGEWIMVPEAEHFIQLDEPAVVLDAIRRVVEMARSSVEPPI